MVQSQVGCLVIYYSTLAPFYHIRSRERAKYVTVLHSKIMYCITKPGFTGFLAEGLEKPNFDVIFSSGIINPLFDGLTYNTHGHFAHCSYFPRPYGAWKNTTQLAKYPRVLYMYVKPSNKMYIRKDVIINMSRAWDKEKSESLTRIEPMTFRTPVYLFQQNKSPLYTVNRIS